MARNVFQQLYHRDLERVYHSFHGIILDNLVGDIPDLQSYFEKLKSAIPNDSRVLISYHNHFWEPVLTMASRLGLRRRVGTQNWLDQEDIKNILNLAGFEIISSRKRFFGITFITIARLKKEHLDLKNSYSVSIVIPVRNEEGNISKIVPSIPKFGISQELIFVEGGSKDKTWKEIKKLKGVVAIKQKGRGKADAVREGFKNAKGDIFMIYDGDMTVPAADLPKFYNALAAGIGEFVNGSRLVYPMEKQAMQTLNKIANKIFSMLFTKILGQRFKDTLCGTKAFFRKDYIKFKKFKEDPFGDFELIFGAIRGNLKVIEIPVRYKERVYGSTNISRFRHGLILARMLYLAYKEFYKSKFF